MARLRQTTRKTAQVFKVAPPKLDEQDWLPKFTSNVNKQLALISERFARIPEIEGFDPSNYVQVADLRDELVRIDEEDEALLDTEGEEEGDIGGGQGRKHNRRTTRRRRHMWEIAGSALEAAEPTAAPPNVAAVSAIGTTTAAGTGDVPRFALEDHTHGGVLGAPVGGGNAEEVAFFTSSFEIDGDSNFTWQATERYVAVGFLASNIVGTTTQLGFTAAGEGATSVRVRLWSFAGASAAVAPSFLGTKTRGTHALPTGLLVNDVISSFTCSGHDGTTFSGVSGVVGFIAEDNWTATNWGTGLQFATVDNGSTTLTEKMRISNNGDIFIFDGNVHVLNFFTGTATELRLYEDGLGVIGNYTGFKSPSVLAANLIYTLPTAFPSADGQALLSTTLGVMSWGTPAGSISVEEDNTLVSAGITTLDFNEPEGTTVTAAAGEAEIDLSRYMLRTGRPTGRNAYILSSDTTTARVSGGTAGGQNVEYESTSSVTKGRILFMDNVDAYSAPSGTLSGTTNAFTVLNTLAFSYGAGTLRFISHQQSITLADDNASMQFARFAPTFVTAAAVVRDTMTHQGFISNPTYTPGAGASITNLTSRGMQHNVVLSNAGTGNTVVSNYAFSIGGSINTNWTATDWAMCKMNDPTGAGGTITRLGFAEIDDLTARTGSTLYSIWSKGTDVPMCHAGDALFGATQSTITTPSATLHAQESTAIVDGTIGGEVFRAETVATADDPNYRMFHGRVTTTNATVTTLASFTIPATTTVLIEARVVARRTGGAAGTAEDSAGYIIKACVKNVAGTATLTTAGATASPTVDFDNNDVAGYNATIDVNGATARVRVTGIANTNITWHATIIVQTVGS